MTSEASEGATEHTIDEIATVARVPSRTIRFYQARYIQGVIAGKLSRTGLAGYVGSVPVPEVVQGLNAFMLGMRSVNPKARLKFVLINSWYDPPKAKEAAFAMMDRKADVMYAERFGVSDAAKERGVKVIGNVIDTSAQYPGTVLASALWNMQPTIDRAVAALLEGRFEAADYSPYSSLALDPALVPPDVAALVEAKKQQILGGEFRVDISEAEPKPTA